MKRALMLALALLLSAFIWAPKAAAQDCQNSGCTKAQARTAAISLATSRGPTTCATVGGSSVTFQSASAQDDPGNMMFAAMANCSDGGSYVAGHTYYSSDPEPPNTCASAIPIANASFTGNSGTICSGGCAYEPDPNAPNLKMNSSIFQAASNWKPTGETCTAPPQQDEAPFDPNKDTCVATGGNYLECVKPDGTHCVTTTDSTGWSKSLCWPPSDTGHKLTQDGKLGGDREKAPSMPSPPKNQTDSALINSTTTTINNNTYNTNTYGGTGNIGGQGNTGTAHPNGEGGTGGGGDGDGGDDGDGAGAPGGGVGTLYEDPGLTAAGIAAEYFGKVMDTPIAGQIRTFMTVPSGGAGCPTFVLPASTFWESMTLDMHCSGAILAALQAAGVLCLAIATYIAARMAFT